MLRSVRVSPDIDWRAVEPGVSNDLIFLWMNIKDRGKEYDFKINLLTNPPYIYDTKSKYASPLSSGSLILVLLPHWELSKTILVKSTIYGTNSGVLADYQNDGTFLSEDGDIWKINELVSWES